MNHVSWFKLTLLFITYLHTVRGSVNPPRLMTTDQAQGCASSPCSNGGTCVSSVVDTYHCWCTPYYKGVHCTEEPSVNVALEQGGNGSAVCTVSSALEPVEDYGCEVAIDGYLDETMKAWSTDNERVGAWFRVDFDNYYRVKRFDLFDRCPDSQASNALRLEMSDLKSIYVSPYCLEPEVTCENKFWQSFDLTPTITEYLHIEVTGVCNPSAPNEFGIGFHGVKVYGNDVALVNTALLEEGTSCAASSEYNPVDFGCENAIDGEDMPGPGTEWMTSAEGLGAWLRVDFPGTYTVMAVGFLQRCEQQNQISELQLSFSSGTQWVILPCIGGVNPLDCEGQTWQQYDLSPYAVTSYVHATVTNTCGPEPNNVGFREIRVFRVRDNNRYG